MPEVIFYVLESTQASSREAFVRRLLGKMLKSQQGIQILLDSDEDIARLDQALWQGEGFIPHLTQSDDQLPTPILLLNQCQPQRPLCLNLAQNLPQNWQALHKIAEILDQDPQRLHAGRQRYKAYKQAGIEPITHKIK